MKLIEQKLKGSILLTRVCYFLVVVAACSVAGVAGLILAGYCWYRFVCVDIFPF